MRRIVAFAALMMASLFAGGAGPAAGQRQGSRAARGGAAGRKPGDRKTFRQYRWPLRKRQTNMVISFRSAAGLESD